NIGRFSRINPDEIVFMDHAAVFVVNLALEYPETFVRIVGITHVHTGLVILHSCAPVEDSRQSCLQWHIEIESNVGLERKAVKFANPRAIATTHGITGKS